MTETTYEKMKDYAEIIQTSISAYEKGLLSEREMLLNISDSAFWLETFSRNSL